MRSKATNLGSVDIGSVVSLSCSGAGGGAETSGLRPVDLSPGTAYPLMYARDCALLWTGACGGWGKREKMLAIGGRGAVLWSVSSGGAGKRGRGGLDESDDGSNRTRSGRPRLPRPAPRGVSGPGLALAISASNPE